MGEPLWIFGTKPMEARPYIEQLPKVILKLFKRYWTWVCIMVPSWLPGFTLNENIKMIYHYNLGARKLEKFQAQKTREIK